MSNIASPFKINGHSYKAPSNLGGLVATLVSEARNASGVFTGQRIGRDQHKLDNLCWNYLTADEWSEILNEFNDSFTFTLEFFDPVRKDFRTITAYPSDRTFDYPVGAHFYNDDGSPKCFFNCKVNFVDTGE